MLLFDFQDLSLALRFAKMMKRYGRFCLFVPHSNIVIQSSNLIKTGLNNVVISTLFVVSNGIADTELGVTTLSTNHK